MTIKAPDSERVDMLSTAWRSELPEEERLLFMRMPLEKQELALSRVLAMNEFDDGTPAVAIHPALGLGRARFYKLVKAWKARRSLASIVPFATEESREKRSKLDPAVISLIENCLRESASAEEQVSEYELINRIRERAKKQDLPVPAAETLSRHLAKAAMRDPAISLAPVTRGTAVNPGDIFAAHLIIDHTTVDLLVGVEKQLVKPTLTIVLDDASRLILGACMSAARPEAKAVASALIDARNRYRMVREQGAHATLGLRPLLSARLPAVAEWLQLDWQLEDAGFRRWNIARAATDHHRGYGRLIRRFMLMKIGDVGLLTSPTWQSPEDRVSAKEAEKFTPLSWADAGKIVEDAIARHNASRMQIAAELSCLSSSDLKSARIGDPTRDYLADALGKFSRLWSSSDSASGE